MSRRPYVSRLQPRRDEDAGNVPSDPSALALTAAQCGAFRASSRDEVKAFNRLSEQPISLVGLSKAERDAIVVTAVADDQGREYPVSHFGDSFWDLRCELGLKNKAGSYGGIAWPRKLPAALVDDAKAALYCALRRGPSHSRRWTASAAATTAKCGIWTLRYLASLGVENFSQVRALYLSDHIADLRRTIIPGSIRNRLSLLDLVWHFSCDVLHPLPEHPWAGSALSDACGCNEALTGPTGHTGKTPVIPRSVQKDLFSYCEAKIRQAQEIFDALDSGEIEEYTSSLTSVRDAVLYLVQITSGMRNSECAGIANDGWRTEVKNGIAFHWVRTKEIKTRHGETVEYLVPPETINALEVLQRIALPWQERIADEARWLDAMLQRRQGEDEKLANGMTVAQGLQRRKHIEEIKANLFLALDRRAVDHLDTGSHVEVMSVYACDDQLKVVAQRAGVSWKLTNHQCRRTFAFNVANSRLGRMGLVFLKWQLKHSSMSWTQLYASNPYQDLALYRDMEDELAEARASLMEGWMQPDCLLSGGAGRKLMQNRAIAVVNVRELLRHTAVAVNIQSTGHAWCLCGAEGCHGQGVYDPALCGGCSQAVIDRDQAAVWQMIHMDNLQLAAIIDCGPAAVQKAERAVKRSVQVLQELGVPLPTEEQARQYRAQTGGM
jgi:hypothetical protein